MLRSDSDAQYFEGLYFSYVTSLDEIKDFLSSFSRLPKDQLSSSAKRFINYQLQLISLFEKNPHKFIRTFQSIHITNQINKEDWFNLPREKAKGVGAFAILEEMKSAVEKIAAAKPNDLFFKLDLIKEAEKFAVRQKQKTTNETDLSDDQATFDYLEDDIGDETRDINVNYSSEKIEKSETTSDPDADSVVKYYATKMNTNKNKKKNKNQKSKFLEEDDDSIPENIIESDLSDFDKVYRILDSVDLDKGNKAPNSSIHLQNLLTFIKIPSMFAILKEDADEHHYSEIVQFLKYYGDFLSAKSNEDKKNAFDAIDYLINDPSSPINIEGTLKTEFNKLNKDRDSFNNPLENEQKEEILAKIALEMAKLHYGSSELFSSKISALRNKFYEEYSNQNQIKRPVALLNVKDNVDKNNWDSLIQSLQQNGIKDLYLFANDRNELENDTKLTELEAQGFTIRGVISPADLSYDKGLGAVHADYIEIHRQSDGTIAIDEEDRKMVVHLLDEQGKKKNPDQLSNEMFQYFLEQKPEWVGSVVYAHDGDKANTIENFDNTIKNLDALPIATIHIKDPDIDEHLTSFRQEELSKEQQVITILAAENFNYQHKLTVNLEDRLMTTFKMNEMINQLIEDLKKGEHKNARTIVNGLFIFIYNAIQTEKANRDQGKKDDTNWIELQALINKVLTIKDHYEPIQDEVAFKKIKEYKNNLDELANKQRLAVAEQKYEQARENLEWSTIVCEDTKLNAYGNQLYINAKKVKDKKIVPSEDLPFLNRCLNGAAHAIDKPEDENALSAHVTNTKKVIGLGRRWGEVVAGSMGSIFGVLLIAASISLAVATWGISTPLSALGIAVGATMVAGTAVAGLTLAGTAGLFARTANAGPVAVAGENVEKAIIKARNSSI